MDDFESEIKNDFLGEAQDMLVLAEESFLKLADGNETAEVISAVFRFAHNLKGSAAAVGFVELAVFAHKVEEILKEIQDGNIKCTIKISLFLLECNDTFKNFIFGLMNDLSFSLNTDSFVIRIDDILKCQSDEALGAKVTVQSHNENFYEVSKASVSSEIKPKPDKEKKETKKKKEFLRIDSEKLDLLLNYVGELVVNQTVLGNHNKNKTMHLKQAKQTIKYMDKLVADVRDISLSLRMMPLKQVFQKMNRIVKDLSHDQNKNIKFITDGEEVELDKTVVEKIGDPLVHLIRNSVDHGIESAAQRSASGKPAQSVIKLIAQQKEDNIIIRVIDDGAGLDKDAIVAKAIQRGIIKNSNSMSDQDIYALIFTSGFSTKDTVTDVSGRGIGMDVVKNAISELKGTIRIETEIGVGTTFLISLPLTLSIIQGMVIEVDDNKFIVPLSQLVETLDYSKLEITSSTQKGRMINLRGEVIPVIPLGAILKYERSDPKKMSESKKGIVTVYNGTKVSFEVDKVLGQQEIVLKNLGDEIVGIPGVFAGAILGDGAPGLVLSLHDFLDNRSKNDRTN